MSDNSVKIAYQNKDISAKILSEHFKGKSFSVYGIDVPEIVRVEPTNLPAIAANELRLDNLFLLSDGSYAIVDYESRYDEANKQKYLEYVARVSKRIYNEYGEYKKIRVIIIYTADVERGKTKPYVDMEGIRLSVTEAFLIELDSEKIFQELSGKIAETGRLEDEEVMKLIVYPLTYKGKRKKQEAIRRAIDLIEQLSDEDQMIFVAKMLLAFTDKVIGLSDSERIRRILMLTKVEQIIANEMQEAVDKAVKEQVKEDKKEARKNTLKIVENFLRSGTPATQVSECTGVSMKEVQRIEKRILKEA